jgi:hypothetical protein
MSESDTPRTDLIKSLSAALTRAMLFCESGKERGELMGYIVTDQEWRSWKLLIEEAKEKQQ